MTTMQEKQPTVTEDLEAGVQTMHVMDSSGDTRHTWDPTNAEEVTAIRKIFEDLTRRARYLAYSVRGDGSRGEVIREFDPEARAIILAPQTVGG